MSPPTSSALTTHLETIATPPDEVTLQEWEESHPGRRLSCPADAPTDWVTYVGDERGGMAAKGQSPHCLDFGSARRFSAAGIDGHGRGRNLPKQLIISGSSYDTKPEIHTAPLPRCRADLYESSVAKTDPIMGATTHELDTLPTDLTDTESDTTVVSPPNGTSSFIQDSSDEGLQFTDFSNYLGDCMDIDKPDHPSSWTFDSDANSLSSKAADEDLYGWDAVLCRKLTNPFEDANSPFQQRRASRSKRSLLQRVLSSGGLAIRDSSPDCPSSLSLANNDAL